MRSGRQQSGTFHRAEGKSVQERLCGKEEEMAVETMRERGTVEMTIYTDG